MFKIKKSKPDPIPTKSPQKASMKDIRLRLLTWSLATFSGTIIFSSILMAFVVFSPGKTNYRPIQEWLNVVVTAQLGIMGAACSYYFGRQHDSNDQGKSD